MKQSSVVETFIVKKLFLQVLAKNRMFLVVTSLFQKFRFLPTEGAMAPDHDPRHYDFGFILQIKNYEISAKARKVGEF